MTDPGEDLQADAEEIRVLAELFHQMADPTRLLLLMSMFGGEKCVCELARLVRSRKKGRHVFYMLDDDHVKDLVFKGLEHVRE